MFNVTLTLTQAIQYSPWALWLTVIYHQNRLGLKNPGQSHFDHISPQCTFVNINN